MSEYDDSEIVKFANDCEVVVNEFFIFISDAIFIH